MVKLKSFQMDDLARLCLLDGAVLAWGCGLGKSLAMFVYGLMKCGWNGRKQVKGPVLIVSPEDLHLQTVGEGIKFFNVMTEKLADQDLSKPLPPGFYIVSYQMLKRLMPDPHAFECVILDEGDKAKKTNSDAGVYVRRLKPRYRLICTATPMADRLRDLFWLCSWVCENDPPGAQRWHSIWAPTEGGFTEFARQFQITGQNLARVLPSGNYGIERSSEIDHLMQLWQVLSPVILRRRMEDTGEDVVGMDHRVVPCPLGESQKQEYERALFDRSVDVGTRLGALRRIAGGEHWPNPKLEKALELIAKVIGRGEQVLVASDFRAPNDSLRERLLDAGVEHVLMDGRTDPEQRGEMALRFKDGQIPVALIGLKSGAEGQSYPKCNNVILLNYSWEYKKLPQVIHRARRINSERDLNIWSLVTQGTIEERMASLVVDEKQVAADLALDGIWPTQSAPATETGWIAAAEKDFNRAAKPVPEREIEARWEKLRRKLQRKPSGIILSPKRLNNQRRTHQQLPSTDTPPIDSCTA